MEGLTETIGARQYVVDAVQHGTWWPKHNPLEMADLIEQVAESDAELALVDQMRKRWTDESVSPSVPA